MLINQDTGLKILYESMKKSKIFSSKQSEDPVKQLNSLMQLYKEWHFHFMPKYEFEHFLNKCRNYGGLPAI